jgi:hypothetical protein
MGIATIGVEATSSDNIDVVCQGSDNIALPGAPINFDAVALSQVEVGLTWTKGITSTHTLVRRQVGSYPATILNGVEVYWGTDNYCTDSIDMTFLDQDVYYRAWSWNTIGYSLTYAEDIVEVHGMIGSSLFLGCLLLIAFGLTFGSYYVKERAILFIAVIAWFGILLYGFANSDNVYDAFWIVGMIGIAMAILCAFGWTRMKKEKLQPWNEDTYDDLEDEEMKQMTEREVGRISPKQPRREPRY